MLLVMCNLKPRALVGFKSHGMVLCAVGVNGDGSERVALVDPPADAKVKAYCLLLIAFRTVRTEMRQYIDWRTDHVRRFGGRTLDSSTGKEIPSKCIVIAIFATG
jgi:hypothetical protein